MANSSIELVELFSEREKVMRGVVYTSLRRWSANNHLDYVLSFGIGGVSRKLAFGNFNKTQSELTRLAIRVYDELIEEFGSEYFGDVERKGNQEMECPISEECDSKFSYAIKSKHLGDVYVCAKCGYVYE